jgi:Ca2+:H+ antiporter
LGRPRGVSPEVKGKPSKEQEIQNEDFTPLEPHNSQPYSGETAIYPPRSSVMGADGSIRDRKPESTKEATEENAQVGDKKKPRKEHRLFKHVEPKEPFTIRNQLQRTFLNSWINVLLLAAPVGIILGAVPGMNKIAIFVVNFIAIIPLAAMLSFATEEIALRTGETLGGLLNATFG